MNAGLKKKKRLKRSTSALTRAQFLSKHCVSIQEAASGSGTLCWASYPAAKHSYWPAPACPVRWERWARWLSRHQRTPARAACFPRRPGDWTVKEQGKKESQHRALPSSKPIDISLFRSLSVSLRPVYCAWFQASSMGSLNNINQLSSSLIFASRQGRQIDFSANLSYLELKKLIRFSLELWFLSSSSCFPSCMCQVQHIYQGRSFQRLRLKFTWTNPLWQSVCIQATGTTHVPFTEEDSVLCNTLQQSTSIDQLWFFLF